MRSQKKGPRDPSGAAAGPPLLSPSRPASELVRPPVSRPRRRQRRSLRHGKAYGGPPDAAVRHLGHVVNLTNDKAVDVRITDRGPFVDGRIIDLSHAAASAIDLIGPGSRRVRLEILSIPATAPAIRSRSVYAVQVGAFRDKGNAERERARLEAKYGAAQARVSGGESLRLAGPGRVGKDRGWRGRPAPQIRKDSGERNAFVIRLDS